MSQPEQPYHRNVKNFLLDARFQLKFASYTVVITLIVAGLLGVFLLSTTNRLFKQAQIAVDARSEAAETSKELGSCSLNNDIAKNLDNPDFDKQLRERSEAIDKAYEAARAQVIAERQSLERQQTITLLSLVGGLIAFVLFVGMGSIVTTHRIVGPLFRVKRMAHEVTAGKLRPPAYGLRPGDELKDVFEAFASMVTSLRSRHELELKQIEEALAAAKAAGAADAVAKLELVRAEHQARLDA